MRKYTYLLFLIFALINNGYGLEIEQNPNQETPQSNPEAEKSDLPQIITADANNSDRWYPYIFRPSKILAAEKGLYPQNVLDKIPTDTVKKGEFVPWTFIATEQPFELKNIVPDRIVDPKTNKAYVVMYHGTTSDLLDIFKPGESALRFDVGENSALGKGFYLAADINEAKAYACERLRQRKPKNNSLQAMLLVVGVLDNEIIKGKSQDRRPPYLSNNDGSPIDNDIYFGRNTAMYNQFVFFSNTHPYLKILYIVLLPTGFGRSLGTVDYDGLEEGKEGNTTLLIANPQSHYHCNI